MPANVVAVSDVDFQQQVLRSAQPVLVAFRAGWCMPSQDLVPVVDKVAATFEGRVRVVSVEVGPKTERLCRSLGVTRLPVVMLFKDGAARDFIGGATDEANIADMIETELKPVVDLSEHNFESVVIESRVPVLVHFWAAACRPSLEMEQVINTLAEKFQGRARVARLEMRPDTARLFARHHVRRVPTTAVFVGGRIQDQIFGAMTGGTKVGGVATSCVGLTSLQNVEQMLDRFVL